ncbi:unnamed protein product [Trifolium pratense]|uniref:Uncharacterized protein n=1 Tax=Trifolium pratense TaxID=57577 RepID=A0ACB0ILE3_TRIPR|nr:unnamed protein product [Trifolium pratense]
MTLSFLTVPVIRKLSRKDVSRLGRRLKIVLQIMTRRNCRKDWPSFLVVLGMVRLLKWSSLSLLIIDKASIQNVINTTRILINPDIPENLAVETCPLLLSMGESSSLYPDEMECFYGDATKLVCLPNLLMDECVKMCHLQTKWTMEIRVELHFQVILASNVKEETQRMACQPILRSLFILGGKPVLKESLGLADSLSLWFIDELWHMVLLNGVMLLKLFEDDNILENAIDGKQNNSEFF